MPEKLITTYLIYPVCRTWHAHLGISQQFNSAGPILGGEAGKYLWTGSIYVLSEEVITFDRKLGIWVHDKKHRWVNGW